MAESLVAAYKEAMARGAQRCREEIGTGSTPDGGEEVPQRGVVGEEGSNRTEDMVQPSIEGDGLSRTIEVSDADVGTMDLGLRECVP